MTRKNNNGFHGRKNLTPGQRVIMPQVSVQQGEMTRLGLCQSCGIEWGCSHVTVEASVVNNAQLRIFHQRFWLCKECEKDFAKKMGRGSGQAERVAWNLTH